MYERIMKRYGGRVVVQVIREFCGGCYVKLPSELAARCRTDLVSCPNCGRFLYYVK
jgi:predicted  nucleic acid-binding Zn-ribbon protein